MLENSVKKIIHNGNGLKSSVLVKNRMENRIREIRNRRGLTLEQLAEAADTTAAQIQRLEAGTRKLTLQWMEKIARALNCKSIDLIVDPEKPAVRGGVIPEIKVAKPHALAQFEGSPQAQLPSIFEFGGDEFGVVGVFDARVSAGPGALNADYPEPEGYRMFPLSWLRSISGTSPDQLAIITVAGDSMEPTLKNADQILIDRNVRHLGRDGLYVLSADHETQVKRLSRDPRDRSITINSDNPKSQSWTGVLEENIHVLGRVLWLGRKVEG